MGGFLMDRIGRKQTMTLGFFLWAALGFIIGGALGPIQTKFALFVVLYGIFNSLGEMGPGVATFLCGAESFPTPLRGHFLGFAAAVGKAGAAIGTQVTKTTQNCDLHIDKIQGLHADTKLILKRRQGHTGCVSYRRSVCFGRRIDLVVPHPRPKS